MIVSDIPDSPLKSAGRILIEGINLTLRTGTGIATYARGLAAAARRTGFAIEVLVSTNRHIPTGDPELAEIILLDGPRHYNLIHKGMIELRRLAGAPFGLRPSTIEQVGNTVVNPLPDLQGFDRIHAIAHLQDVERLHFLRHKRRLKLKLSDPPQIFHATRPAPLQVPGAANIYTIHDVVPLRLPYTTADDKPYHLAMLHELARTADHIVTVSEFSRRDIIDLIGVPPERITNTYQTVEFPPELLAEDEVTVARALARKHGLEYKDYFLFVGAIEPKKNISRLIDAYAASGVRRPLVLAGGLGWMYTQDIEKISSERFLSFVANADGEFVPRRRVRHLSYLPLRDVVQLIRGARALLYPSIYEGFGLPAAEAMLLGTPVMTSKVASLPEITDGAAQLVNPYDTEEMANAIRMLDEDDDLVRELSERGVHRARVFSASEHAARITAIYRHFSTPNNAAPVPPPIDGSEITPTQPLPPSQSG